jgi:hypothetical protein
VSGGAARASVVTHGEGTGIPGLTEARMCGTLCFA